MRSFVELCFEAVRLLFDVLKFSWSRVERHVVRQWWSVLQWISRLRWWLDIDLSCQRPHYLYLAYIWTHNWILPTIGANEVPVRSSKKNQQSSAFLIPVQVIISFRKKHWSMSTTPRHQPTHASMVDTVKPTLGWKQYFWSACPILHHQKQLKLLPWLKTTPQASLERHSFLISDLILTINFLRFFKDADPYEFGDFLLYNVFHRLRNSIGPGCKGFCFLLQF